MTEVYVFGRLVLLPMKTHLFLVPNVLSTPTKTSEKVKSLSHIQLFATPWTVAYQASPSMGFSRQEYRSALPFPSPGDLLNPGIEPGSPALQADALPSEPPGKLILPKLLPILKTHLF